MKGAQEKQKTPTIFRAFRTEIRILSVNEFLVGRRKSNEFDMTEQTKLLHDFWNNIGMVGSADFIGSCGEAS